MRAFLTGTDTGVGKTYVTALLTRALRRAGLDTLALKPVCSGDRDDAKILRSACDEELKLDEINPVWFQSPVAPLLASRMEHRNVSLSALKSWFHSVSQGRQSLLVEGVGGWLVPLADKTLVADLAAVFGLPVILVVANRLGCVNHTLLTLESIRARRLECRGIILNSLARETDASMPGNRALIEEFTPVPVLFEILPDQETIDLAIVWSAGPPIWP